MIEHLKAAAYYSLFVLFYVVFGLAFSALLDGAVMAALALVLTDALILGAVLSI